MKKLLYTISFAVFIAVLGGLMGFIYMEQGKQNIESVKIQINRSEPKGFVTEAGIRELISGYDSLVQKQARQVNTNEIEKEILQNPHVLQADAFVNIDKELIINIAEKKALLRVITGNDRGFYIDHDGSMFPTSNNFSPRILVASGHIGPVGQVSGKSVFDSAYVGSGLDEMFVLAQLIREHRFLSAQIAQIYRNSVGEYDLVPVLGNHLIKLGKAEDFRQKLEKLVLFYKHAMPGEGWDKYEIINLKYKNQVVCKRKQVNQRARS